MRCGDVKVTVVCSGKHEALQIGEICKSRNNGFCWPSNAEVRELVKWKFQALRRLIGWSYSE